VGASRGRADHPGSGDGRDRALEGRPGRVVGHVQGREPVVFERVPAVVGVQGPIPASQHRLKAVRLEPSPGVYFWDVPAVFHLYPACISHRILGIPCIPVSILYLSILQQMHCHCIPLYPTVSSCIRKYLAVSSCIPLYLTVSHRLENRIWPKIQSRGGLPRTCPTRGQRRAGLLALRRAARPQPDPGASRVNH